MSLKLYKIIGYLILIATILMTGTPLNSNVEYYFAVRYYDLVPGWLTIIICALGFFLVKSNNFNGIWVVVGANLILALLTLIIVRDSVLPIGPAVPIVIILTIGLAFFTFNANEFQTKYKKQGKQQIAHESKVESQDRTKGIDNIEDKNSTISTNDFVNDVQRLKSLYINGIYDQKEYENKKHAIILKLASQKLTCSHNDFLFGLISLKENSVLTNEEIAEIKRLIK